MAFENWCLINRCERFNVPIYTGIFCEKMMDMSLDELIKCELEYISYECNTPQYLKDFYNETTHSEEWLNLTDNDKLYILDTDLENYMKYRTEIKEIIGKQD